MSNSSPKPAVNTSVTGSSDFYHIVSNSLSSSEMKLYREFQSIIHSKVRPLIDEHTEHAEFPHSLLPVFASLKICGLDMNDYGCPGLSARLCGILALELSKVSMGLATFLFILQPISMSAIYRCGSEEQKTRYLPSMSRLEKIGCFGLTEPDAGSDAAHLKCKAVKDKNSNEWVINGEKRWIGNGTFADIYIIWCSGESQGSVLGFIVEKDAVGLNHEKIQYKTALREVQNAHIFLNNVRVNDNQRLPLAHSFNTGPAKSLFLTRIVASFIAVGGCMGAYESALTYTKKRKQFNSELAGFQLTQEKLVRSLSQIQAMLLMSRYIADMYDSQRQQLTYGMVGSLKAHNTLTARYVLADLRTLLGGNGILTNLVVAKAQTDIEAVHTYEGSYEVNVLIAAREITGLAAFKSPTSFTSKL